MQKIVLFISSLFVFQALQAQQEYTVVKEAGFYYLTKIDSASEYSVINASRIVVMNSTFPISKNVGKEVSFAAINEKGEKRTINSRVAGTAKYNSEEKYVVELTLSHENVEKKTMVILADLSTNEFKLIAGKNRLK